MTCRKGHPAQHPAFPEGNTVALRHGARSPRMVEALADQVLAAAVEDAPWLAADLYTPAVRAWARSEAQAILLADYLDEHGLHDAKGRLRPAEQALHRAETRAANARARLGLDPVSRAALRRDEALADRGPTVLDLMQLEQERSQAGGPGAG